MASLAIFVFMIIVLVQIVETATGRLRNVNASTPTVLPASVLMMLATLAINMLVVRYESTEGRRLNSPILGADAKHTRSDVWTTSAVLVALLGAWLGYPRLDPFAGLVVAIFIGRASWQIARDASGVLADQIVIPEDDIRSVVDPTPGVIGCEKIRTRGPADNVFVDLHLWIDGRAPLAEAHAISHVVKDRLMQRFPQVADVVIHIEPPTLGNPIAQIPNPKAQSPNPKHP
jgi:cation diffusion facilitator family transporter